MSRCIARRLTALLIAWMVIPLTMYADDPSIDDICASLRQWRSKFANIRIVYEQRNLEELREYHPELRARENLDNYFWRMEWIWTDHGPGRFDFKRFEDGIQTKHQFDATNGNQNIKLQYQEGNSAPTKTKERYCQRLWVRS